MNISSPDIQINRTTPPSPINQGTFPKWVNWKSKLLMNTMLLEMHILKWNCGYVAQLAEMKTQFFTRAWNVFDRTVMSVHDPYGHEKENLKWNTHNVDNLSDIYTQQQTKHEHCPSTQVIAPSLPLKSDMEAPFKPPALLLAGLIPPPQWWMRGIKNPSICMANYLQRGSQVSAWPAFQKYW